MMMIVLLYLNGLVEEEPVVVQSKCDDDCVTVNRMGWLRKTQTFQPVVEVPVGIIHAAVMTAMQ